ncbi:MAG: ABC transporter substrate-binding protein [Patulibacter sp.]
MRHISRARAALAVLSISTVLVACGDESSSDQAAATSTPTSEVAFPLTLKNCGSTLKVAQPAERIYSGNYEMTENLLALGLEDRIVGAAKWSDAIWEGHRKAAAKLNILKEPGAESVLDLKPDLVAGSWDLYDYGLGKRKTFDDLVIVSYISPSACTDKEDSADYDAAKRTAPLKAEIIYTELEELGQIAGVPSRADALVADLKQRVTNATRDDFSGVSVMFWFGNTDSPYIGGCCGAPGIIAHNLGLTNVFENVKQEWPKVSWEKVVAKNPDVIIMADLGKAEKNIKYLESDPAASTLDAVKHKRIIAVPAQGLTPSVTTFYDLEAVAKQLRALGFGK